MGKVVHTDCCPICGSNSLHKEFSAVDYLVSQEPFDVWICDHCGFRFTQDVPDEQEIGVDQDGKDYVGKDQGLEQGGLPGAAEDTDDQGGGDEREKQNYKKQRRAAGQRRMLRCGRFRIHLRSPFRHHLRRPGPPILHIRFPVPPRRLLSAAEG